MDVIGTAWKEKGYLAQAAARLKPLALQAGLIALLSGSRMIGELSPFVAAGFAAAQVCGRSPWAMLAGATAYAALEGWSPQSLASLSACLLIALTGLALRRLLPGRRVAALREVICAFQAGGAVLLPGLLTSGALPYNVLTTVISAMIAALLAPALIDALQMKLFSRRRFLPEERLSAALLTMMLLISLCSFPYLGRELAQAAAVLVTLVMAANGPAMGAAGGIACGTALALGTGVASFGSTLALGGLLAGCMSRLPRPLAGLAVAAGNALALTYGIGYTLGALDWLPLGAGVLAACALPERLTRALNALIAPPAPVPDQQEQDLAGRGRLDAARQLKRLGAVFETLAEGYAEEGILDEAAVVRGMREALCSGCADYEKCWQGDHPEAGRLMCRLLSEALCGGDVTSVLERPPELVRHCRRSTQIDARLGPLLSETAQTRRQMAARGDLKALMSGQFRQAAAFLSETGESLSRSFMIDGDMSALVCATLEKAGFAVKQAVVSRETRCRIRVLLTEGAWTTAAARRAAEALSEELGFSLMFSKPDGGEICFSAQPRLRARVGKGLCAAQADAPCGDTAHAEILPDGRLMIALSDGMGSGEGAAAESLRTIGLIRTFLEAGLDSARSLQAINALLQLGGGELFATVDLCLIDLNSGQARLNKLGACATLLLRGGHLTELSGGHLPIGILDKVTPGEQTFRVEPGDVLIFHSDGIADDLREGQSLWLCRKVLACKDKPPEQMARLLLQAAIQRCAGKERDDMSLFVVRIDKKRIAKSHSETAAAALPEPNRRKKTS